MSAKTYLVEAYVSKSDSNGPAGIRDRAVLAILDDSQFKRELESRAYEYGKEMAWPNVGRRVLELTRELLAVPEGARLEPEEAESTEVPLAHA